MIRISAISYLNAYPFIYGLQKSGILSNYLLEVDYPAVCAEKLLNNRTDIGLAPVAVIPELKHYEILTDYCIGADGPVETVLLLGSGNRKEIRTIYLDIESKTSINLIKIISKFFWKTEYFWKSIKDYDPDYEDPQNAFVLIGDKTFTEAKKFQYKTDLSEEWKKYTGLPFVFACWIANKELPLEFKNRFNEAIRYGILNKKLAVMESQNRIVSRKEMLRYIENSISYYFDEEKKKGLKLFLHYLELMNDQ